MIKTNADKFMIVVGVIADGHAVGPTTAGQFPGLPPGGSADSRGDKHAAQSTHRRAEA
jgi:hypothetical protein